MRYSLLVAPSQINFPVSEPVVLVDFVVIVDFGASRTFGEGSHIPAICCSHEVAMTTNDNHAANITILEIHSCM